MTNPKAKSADKYEVIIELAKQGVKPEGIISLTLANITPKGIIIGNNTYNLSTESQKAIGRYVKKSLNEIQEFLYPGKNGQSTVDNLVNNTKIYLKRNKSMALSDIGWTSQRVAKEPEVYPETLEELAKFLEEQLKN